MSQGCTYILCNKGRTEHSTVRKLIKACSSMLSNGFNNKEYKCYLADHRCCEIRIHQDPTCSWSCVRCSMSKCVLAFSRFGVFGQFKWAFIQPWRFTFVGTQFLAVCTPPSLPSLPSFHWRAQWVPAFFPCEWGLMAQGLQDLPAMGAVPSSSWLPILEAPGYSRHLTSTSRRSCLSKFFEKKEKYHAELSKRPE